jgi:hypothetical protein
VLAPAQRERAREVANTCREQALERRELLRGSWAGTSGERLLPARALKARRTGDPARRMAG